VRLLQDLLTRQAQTRPEAIAIVDGSARLTFRELEESSNQLARLLQASGCRRGDRVCLLIPKSPAAIVAMLGILKADCLYVPLDTASPAPRLARILASCQPRCVLTTAATATLLQELRTDSPLQDRVNIGWMDLESVDLIAHDAGPLAYQNGTGDGAHILFTSGSTGHPKGVVITHSNVLHFVSWATSYFGMNAGDRVSGHPPLHFDLSTFDLFGALAVGAELHLVPPGLSLAPQRLAAFIRTSELSQWFSVPSLLHYMAKFDVVTFRDFPALKRILWCGEVLPTPALVYWMERLPGVQFTNLYGPTEATIASAYFTVPECPADARSEIPIGRACDGERLRILDEDLKPVPNGEMGMLYIGGVGLSPGYWKDPENTAAAFLDAPMGNEGIRRLYKTGDLARTGPDGLVYFLGRSDSQIKSRGYRIELGEIESALHATALVKECAVVGLATEGFEGTAICCGYVPQGAEVTVNALRGALARLVPSYMLPTKWLALPALPRNANGKIDRKQIREQFSMAVLTS
jgi:amino acid adenylation domain-containing protein